MYRFARIPAIWMSLALLVTIAGSVAAQDSSVVFTKTVGLDPNECAESNILPQVPEDGIVYYCYKIAYTGAISASCHTLTDSVLGDVLHKVPGGRCCTNASGTNCDPDVNADSKCELGSNPVLCNDPMYPVCAAVTFNGTCCNDEEGTDCPIPNEGCDEEGECSSAPHCVINPIVADGQMVTRVITATVPPAGIANQATWTAEAGICCDDTQNTCDGSDNPIPCATSDDCLAGGTCRKEGIGLCCTSAAGDDCDAEAVCLSGRECDDETFDVCVLLDTAAEAGAAARVGVFETPAVSAAGMALLILLLAGLGLYRVNRGRQPA
jgi:hypothetical protein